MSDEPAFELARDGNHLGDDETDATLVRFNGYDRVAGFIGRRPLDLPERIYFEANIETLKAIDYPFNDVGWPIMSERMRAALLAVGSFQHRIFPVMMLDDTVEPKFDAEGEPLPEVVVRGFAAVQLTEYCDAFDWDRSEYVRNEIFEGQILKADKLVLKNVALPPLFRLSALPRRLLVSAAGRRALEVAGIGGVKFHPLHDVF